MPSRPRTLQLALESNSLARVCKSAKQSLTLFGAIGGQETRNLSRMQGETKKPTARASGPVPVVHKDAVEVGSSRQSLAGVGDGVQKWN